MSEFAWLIETDGPHYIAITSLGGTYRFEWTRDANKALRFAREKDADDAMMGLREMYEDLFKFPTLQATKPVEHGWDVDKAA